ncbi:HNH endonuclease [Streptomyces sp. NPDC045456]|uniref:HNH endonuclease n=1 Tax=Streptomyces sp. NPDC045456 TaxID=3155254 RepID=UPI003402BA89
MTDTQEAFWSRVHKTDTCWEWTGGTRGNGYGTYWANGTRYYAHRYSYYLTHGVMPAGVILHHCDFPLCVRPDHLADGTQADNIVDMWAKGRGVAPPLHIGEAHHQTRLTKADILRIRAQYAAGIPQQTLADQYGLARSTVGKIVRLQSWRHIHAQTKAAA